MKGAEVEGHYRNNMNKEGEQMEADVVGAKRDREEVEGGESASEEDNLTSENNEGVREIKLIKWLMSSANQIGRKMWRELVV